MAGTATTYATQRGVAARNRATILDVARRLFAQSQTVSMNEVAKRAGVGAGTLYRHFASREDLILAVYWEDLERLVGSVDDVLAAAPSARAAFETWFETLAAYIRLKHGLGDALQSAEVQAAIDASYAPVTAAVATLLDACVAERSARPGLDPGDVLLLMGYLWRVPPTEDGVAQGRRILDLVFAGMAPRD